MTPILNIFIVFVAASFVAVVVAIGMSTKRGEPWMSEFGGEWEGR
jgi:hypothetical protein